MMNLKKKSDGINSGVIIAVVTVVIGTGVAYKFIGKGSDGAKFYKDSPVVATVDNKPVYQAEVDNIVKAVLGNSGNSASFKDLDDASKKMIVREVAAQRAMIKEADTKGIKEDDDMKRKVYEFKNKLIIDQLLAKFVSTEVTQAKMLEKYDEIEKNVKGKQQIKVSHILLNSEDEANNVIEHLKKEPFSKVAKEVSLDSSTKDKGGDLGYILAGTMDPEFEKAALALKPGDISAPVKTKFGWHVIKLEEKRLATVAPFESLKPRIGQDIYNEALRKHADSLLEGVKIELVAPSEKKNEKADEDKKPEPQKEVKKEEPKKEEQKK